MALGRDALRVWCERAGVKPCPRSVNALGRGAGLGSGQTWRFVTGERLPKLPTLERMAQELRVPMGDVAVACLEAWRDRKRRDEVERARLEAEVED